MLNKEFRVAQTQELQVDSLEKLAAKIEEICGSLKVLAVAVSGPVDYEKSVVLGSIFCPWIVGNLPKKLKALLGHNTKIILLNDGDAHALAMTGRNDIVFGAISIALGSAIGFGVINDKGELLRTLSGNNWELGHCIIADSPLDDFDYSSKAGYLFGTNGLSALKAKFSKHAYENYAELLANFLLELTFVFQPKTIYFTGGIIKFEGDKFIPMVDDYLAKNCKFVSKPKIIKTDDYDSALSGLAMLVKKDCLGRS
jgi:predicted NBD/HSP70 family sugar kinase